MTHEEIRARLMGALEGALDPQEADEVEDHVSSCADCRLEQAELHRLHRSMAWADRQEDARLRAATASGGRRIIAPGGWVRLALLAATALVFSLVFSRILGSSPSGAHRSPAASAAAPAEEDGIVTVEMKP